MIDRNNVYWQELPDSINGDEFYHFNYENGKFFLADVALDDGCLTGKSNLKFNLTVSQLTSIDLSV